MFNPRWRGALLMVALGIMGRPGGAVAIGYIGALVVEAPGLRELPELAALKPPGAIRRGGASDVKTGA